MPRKSSQPWSAFADLQREKKGEASASSGRAAPRARARAEAPERRAPRVRPSVEPAGEWTDAPAPRAAPRRAPADAPREWAGDASRRAPRAGQGDAAREAVPRVSPRPADAQARAGDVPRRAPDRLFVPRKDAAAGGASAGKPNLAAMECLTVCPLGLEDVTAAEMRKIGLRARSVEADRGVVEWGGSFADVQKANLWLRTAERVAVRLATFRATHFAQLRHKTADIAWEAWLMPSRAITLRVSADTSKLYHERAIAERVAGGIEDRLGRVVNVVRAEGDHEGAGSQLILVRMHKDDCTISLDTSGDALHRRGYRLATAKAPMRETLAAALLLRSGWDGTTPFADPFCGSGTLPIEAALIARNLAPGRNRRFAFEEWPLFEREPWEHLKRVASGFAKPAAPVILGRDRDAGAIEASRANAERAGVAADVSLEVKSVSDFAPPADTPPGWVVTNPPYGHRVEGGGDLRNLYARLGQVLRQRFPGWHALALCSHPAFAHALGCDFKEGPWFNNGGIRVKALKVM